MSAFTNYTEAKILNRLLNAQADANWAQIASVYVGLFTAAPSDAGGGTEVATGSYARVTVTAGWTVSSIGHAQNTSDVTFPTASANWGTVTHFGVFDASTAGNLLMWGALTENRVVNTGSIVKFLAGELQFDFTGFLSDYAEEKILNRILNAQADAQWAVITSVYLALFTVTPGETGGGTEVTGGSYARKQVTAGFTVASGDAENTAEQAFVQATGSWGTVVALGIFDAATSGNLLIYGLLTEARTVNSGGQAKFIAGSFDLNVD